MHGPGRGCPMLAPNLTVHPYAPAPQPVGAVPPLAAPPPPSHRAVAPLLPGPPHVPFAANPAFLPRPPRGPSLGTLYRQAQLGRVCRDPREVQHRHHPRQRLWPRRRGLCARQRVRQQVRPGPPLWGEWGWFGRHGLLRRGVWVPRPALWGGIMGRNEGRPAAAPRSHACCVAGRLAPATTQQPHGRRQSCTCFAVPAPSVGCPRQLARPIPATLTRGTSSKTPSAGRTSWRLCGGLRASTATRTEKEAGRKLPTYQVKPPGLRR